MKKKHVIILISLVVLVVGFLGVTFIKSYIENVGANHDKQVAAITITNVDLAKVADGTYSGSFKVFPVSAEVKVTVENHTITQIQLVKHKNGQGSAAEVIPDKVVAAQSLDVDIISGATSSSKVILKAIENALNSAIK